MRIKPVVHRVALAIAAMGLCAVMPAMAAPAKAASTDEPPTAANARRLVHDATQLVRTLRHDRKLARLLARSRGVFLVPHYGRGGIVLGGVGGTGLLLAHRNGAWYGPAFYTVSGFNIGVQVGAMVGPVAMFLMSNRSVALFENHKHKWSLDTSAGVTVVKYGGEAEGTGSYGDVVLWSALKGLYGGVSVGASGFVIDPAAIHGYYHHNLSARQIMAGRYRLSHGHALQIALAGASRTRRVAKK